MLRHSIIKTVAALAFGLAVGCVGQLDPTVPDPGGDDDPLPGGPDAGGVPTSSARQTFDSQVRPILLAACASCHAGNNIVDGPDFLGATIDSAYQTLTFDMRLIGSGPDNSMLLLKGLHTGPAFTTQQAAVVSGWIDQEVDERGIEPPPPPVEEQPPTTLTAALQRFGDCMALQDFELTNMQDVANQGTEDGPCYACHATGTAGAFLSQNDTDMFNMTRQSPYILKLTLGTVNTDGSFKDLVPARRFSDKGQEEGLHPSYILTAEREEAIRQFYDLTYQRYLAGGCAPGLPPQ
jgi:hypothetical protein